MANMTTDSGANSAPALSLVSRLVGVITSPKATFQAIAAHPKWFGAMAVTIIVSAVCAGGFMLSKVGQEAWLDAAIGANAQINDQQIAAMERMAPYVGYFAIISIVVFIPVLYVVVSGILYAVFNAAMGGNATFKQVMAVVTHTGVIGLLGQLFTVPLNYTRGSMTSATNLAVVFPFVPETSFLGRLLGTVELFLIWQLIVLAIGLGVLYRKRTQPIAISLFVVYAIIGLIIAFVRSSFGGSN
jgi:hypothetical protein